MENKNINNIEILDDIIVGRVEPHIYAFTTNTVPNYLKVGDTYRPVSVRLKEWQKYFPTLEKEYEGKAIINENVYFRDYSIHSFLEKDLKKTRLLPDDIDTNVYYSNEFFKDTCPKDIEEAIEDIYKNYEKNNDKYEYYNSENRLPEVYHYKRGASWELRPNQKEAVDNFINAVNNGRKNLLMYAVMRFGKSFTSICCGKEMGAKVILVLSAKADVKDEWKKTVEGAGNFEEYAFLDTKDLISDENKIKETLKEKRVVIFLTLQDLQGTDIKDKHRELFNCDIDLLIVDETHFGARAESFGAILRDDVNSKYDAKNLSKLSDEEVDIVDATNQIKTLKSKIRLHLSGTPYRILMGSEFEKEDIISFVQFSDIVKEKEYWDKENLCKDDVNEWDNPYFGFPQMVRFAFNPNESSIKKMEKLKSNGVSFAFSALFEPYSIKKDKKLGYKKFKNEKEISDLLSVIDGSKEDENLLGFLDYDKIKNGKMCRHIVMVLPYCASCDSMEELISNNKNLFKNLGEYKIVNISGVDAHKNFKNPSDIKNKIQEYEENGDKTITLTVNRMLTGSTVKEWDAMLYFKDTASPQEYDQAIFRLQNQYLRTLASENGVIKENLKPQTLLVDFEPNRLFRMQEQKSLIYNVNTDKNGNSKLKERIEEELRISPVIMMNNNKIKQVEAVNILEVVSNYNSQRSVNDEVKDIPIDLSILLDEEIRKRIELESEFNSKGGLSLKVVEGEGEDLDIDEESFKESQNDNVEKELESNVPNLTDKDDKVLERQIQSYYQRILFFAFLTSNIVASLDDVVKVIESNGRLSNNLSLDKKILSKIAKNIDPFKRSSLDYKIQNICSLANDEKLPPLDRALTSLKKFNRMSDSEIMTPLKVCEDMISLIPEEKIKNIISKNKKFLDIASKSAEFTIVLYKRLVNNLKYSHKEVKGLLYSIPTSSIAYEFTRKFYEILQLDINNIAEHFNSYSLLEVKDDKDELDCEKIASLISNNKFFSEITLKEEINEGEKYMKFGTVVGNPPYQENIENRGEQPPIYNKFYDIAMKLSNNVVFITPARFLFNVGKTPRVWNEKMLNDDNFSVLKYYSSSKEVFDNVDIKGGVCITTRNSEIKYGAIKEFIASNEAEGIVKKVRKKENLMISDILYSNTSYKYSDEFFGKNPNLRSRVSGGSLRYLSSSVFSKFPEVFFDENPNDNEKYVVVLGRHKNQRVEKYFNKKYLIFPENFDSYKVYLASSNGTGALGEALSQPVLGYPGLCATETFISLGNFKSQVEAENLIKYIKTKFLRLLLGTKKVTQGNKNKNVWSNIPVQDFSNNSDIDWSKEIFEIDKQLFKKYNLSEEEQEFVTKNIKEM